MKKPLATIALAACAAFCASAATVDLANVSADTTLADGDIAYGTLGGNYKVSIAAGATVVLSNAVINGVNDSACPWAGLTCLGDAQIALVGANTVKGFEQYYPGIFVPEGCTLRIKDGFDYFEGYAPGGSLTVRCGNGNVGYAAGIGAGHSSDANRSCGDIVIQSGKVTAYGGQNSAGIGGAYGAACGRITIYGGDIDASSINYGPGIGGGRNGSCGRIYIEGGTVVAKGGYGSAGICGPGATCPEVVINPGIDSVTAISGGGGRTPIETLGVDKISVDDSLLDTTSVDGLTRTIVPAPVWDGDLATLTGDVTIESDMTLYGELAGQYKISIADGVTVTLNGAAITNGEDRYTYPWAGLTCLGDAEIVLAPGSANFVKGFYQDYPGIYVPENKTLTISGSGSLVASSSCIGAAGIGGGYQLDCGSIVINGGTITATGGDSAAGIGSGDTGHCGSITINGGTVVATGDSAGIGTGYAGVCGAISITGGDVTATGGDYSAGIGGGNTGSCGDITITGGTVSATGQHSSAGIGGGSNGGGCGDITIGAGITRVVATSGNAGADPIGKGAGSQASCGTVTVDPSLTDDLGDPTRTITSASTPPPVWNGDLATLTHDVTVESDMTIYGTLAGQYKISIADGVTVTLDGAVIEGENDSAYSWAGLTCLGDAEIVLAAGSANFVKGFYDEYPGIYVPENKTLTISGSGSLDASSNGAGAGIGGGYQLDCGSIVIEGGVITATGGYESAGIGAGRDTACGTITITGGQVTATGGKYAAGIGTGDFTSSCGAITITGGSVTATGGTKGSGIGSADDSSSCGAITIGADIIRVVATRGDEDAEPIGKGAGDEASCGTVTVDPSLTDTTSADDKTRTILGASVWDGNLATLSGDATALDGTVIHGTLSGSYKITIADGAKVTLDGAAITNGVSNSNYSWAGLNCLGDAEIVLAAGSANFVKGFYEEYPGIYVPENKTLTISGSGSLDASSNGYGAGIGGGYEIDGGNVVIDGGLITASGGMYAAGIGSGRFCACGNITIAGGIVTATGGKYAAGIGGGSNADCGNITITGGRVTATGGDFAAGIGTGDYTSSCGAITITSGSVTATGGFRGSGIGSADDSSSCGAITIGAGIGRVVATRGDEDAEPIGKGAGSSASCGTVTVDPSLTDTTSVDGNTRTVTGASFWDGNLATLTHDVTVESDMTIYGRLGGLYKISVANGVTLTLNGIEIPGTGNSSYKMAGIECLGNATIILAAGSVNTVKGCYQNPGIYIPRNYTLTIKGTGSLSATGGDEGTGIGGGYMRSYGDIVIESGTITATGKSHAAGIGSSDGASYAGDITILGGTVTATGGSFSAGIGGGDVCGNITISGGNVTATGANLAPGIGCGWNEHESFTVRIDGGTVTAIGGEKAAGIGGGKDSEGGTIVIEAGATLVTAKHGTGCENAIGAGDGGSGFTVTVDSGLFDVTDGDTRTISHVVPPVQNTTVGGTTWYYRARGTGVEIYRDEPPAASPVPSGALEIPSSLGGCQVVAVGASVFASSAGFSSVAIPDGVKTIGQQAFYGCQSLTSVTIPGSVTSIGTSAFASTGLATVYVPEGRTDFVKGLLLASGHEQAFVDGITFVEIPWNGNLAGLYYDMTITRNMTIYGELAGQYKISIADGVTVTLDGAAITNGVDGKSYSWAGLTCLGDAEIVLAADSVNSVKGFYYEYPGIYIPVGKTLTISGSGSLDARSNGQGAGIGAGYDIDCGDIVIDGGTITAIGGGSSAGIGGGRSADCGAITINGGTITATGGSGAAGIGSGYVGECGDIAVNGGTVVAAGGSSSAGIGGGYGGKCGSISVGEGVTRIVATCGNNCTNPIGAGGNYGTMTGELYIHPSLEDDGESPTRTIGELPAFVNGTTGGNAYWTVLGDGTWKSGEIGDNQVTWASVPVTGPCVVSFSWKTSSESRCDKLHCYVDGVEIPSAISGVMSDWADIDFVLREGGVHKVKFAYTKDNLARSGEDCGWVKNFTTASFVARTVTFDANGGTLADDEMEAADGFAIGELPVPAWNGAGRYMFTGWYTEVSGGTRVTAVTIVRSDMTLYAHWEEYAAPAFTTGGDADWTEQSDGSWKSGTIDNNGNTWISTTATGKGTISFKWKVSSENGYDGVLFYIDDEYMASFSGEQDWTTRTFTVSTTGTHTFKWMYKKDSSTSRGDDCAWIDEVVWTPDAGGYDSWATENGVSGEWNAVDASGVANVFRYAFNKPSGAFTDPVLLDIAFNEQGKAVILTPPLVNTDGFTFTIEASDNVGGTGNAASYPLDASGETVIDETGKTTRFFRLKAVAQ